MEASVLGAGTGLIGAAETLASATGASATGVEFKFIS
jgi:hypothetical protein